MIQPLRIQATPIRNNTSFGQENGQIAGSAGRYVPKQHSKSSAIANYIGGQFITGALCSGLWDSGVNLFNVLTKRPDKIRSLPTMGINAAVMGVFFALVGGVIAAMDIARNKK